MARGPEVSPGFLMWHATLRWQRRVTAALRPLDLTHVQFVLLAHLWWFDQGGFRPNQLELADNADVDVKMTSQVLRRLERRHLVVREVDPADTRAKRLRITADGHRLAEEAVAVVEAADQEFFAPVTDQEQLLATLRSLAHTDR